MHASNRTGITALGGSTRGPVTPRLCVHTQDGPFSPQLIARHDKRVAVTRHSAAQGLHPRGLASPAMHRVGVGEGEVGWPTRLEPVTFGATIRGCDEGFTHDLFCCPASLQHHGRHQAANRSTGPTGRRSNRHERFAKPVLRHRERQHVAGRDRWSEREADLPMPPSPRHSPRRSQRHRADLEAVLLAADRRRSRFPARRHGAHDGMVWQTGSACEDGRPNVRAPTTKAARKSTVSAEPSCV